MKNIKINITEEENVNLLRLQGYCSAIDVPAQYIETLKNINAKYNDEYNKN